MQPLGDSRTYPRKCSDCGKRVFAHTNGSGDFVLLDTLGQPWPIHPCYLARQDRGSDAHTNPASLLKQALEFSMETPRRSSEDRNIRPPRAIVRVTPDAAYGVTTVIGYVQDVIERRAARKMDNAHGTKQQWLRKLIGDKASEITIIDSGLRSFTMFADLRQVPLARRSVVAATIRPVRLPDGLAFLCDALEVLPGTTEDAVPACRA
jgi:hypothetical protein